MSVRKLLEDLDIENIDDEVVVDDNMDVVDDIKDRLIVTDEEGNLVSAHIYANTILTTYELTEEELMNLLKESGEYFKFFTFTLEGVDELVIGNELCTIEDIKEEFLSSLEDGEELEFDVVEIKDEEETNEGFYNDNEDYIYYCVSDGMNPRNSIILPNSEDARERAIQIAKDNQPKYKYVSMFKNGEEIVIWNAEDFDPSINNMHVENLEECKVNVRALHDDGSLAHEEVIEIEGPYDSGKILTKFFEKNPEYKQSMLSLDFIEESIKEQVKEGPSDIFGYINGDLESFDPKAFIEKVKARKTSLHTNRIIKDTDNLKVCHHIVCETLGWGDEPRVYIDVVEETWTRNSGDADDINSYSGEETQDRILMKNCGKGEEGFAKAIEVLEQYKKDTLGKNESLQEGHQENISKIRTYGELNRYLEKHPELILKSPGKGSLNVFKKDEDGVEEFVCDVSKFYRAFRKEADKADIRIK